MNKSLSFTGYRPNRLGGFAGEKAMAIQTGMKRKAIEVIRRAHSMGYNEFISGGALGTDQIIARAVIEVRGMGYLIRLLMAVPFPSQPIKWPPHAREYYERLLAKADEVVYCNEDPYAAWKMQKRNEWMVNRGRALCAFWAGDPGGTANCVQYARSVKKPILIINPYTLQEKWEGLRS